MSERPTEGERDSRPKGEGLLRHEIERTVARLNTWFAAHQHRIPRCWHWGALRRQRVLPEFRAVHTTAIGGWTVNDLNRLYRVLPTQAAPEDDVVLVPIELLAVDKSVNGSFLDVARLMAAVLEIITGRHLLGRFSPRVRGFVSEFQSVVSEVEAYATEIRMRVDAATPVNLNRNRVFEEFSVPLESGQQTAIGRGCFFALEYAQPQGASPHWRFSILQDGEAIVGPHVLKPKPIYHGEELVAVIKKIGPEAVTLSVLTSESGSGGVIKGGRG